MEIESMSDEQLEKIQNALFFAGHAVDILGEPGFKPSVASGEADRILRETLRSAGRRISMHKSSKDAMRAWEMVQKSIKQLEPLGAQEIIDKLKLAQAELHKMFSDGELNSFLRYQREHEHDYDWVAWY